MAAYSGSGSGSSANPPNRPSHWTVRSPYRTIIREGDGEHGVSNKPGCIYDFSPSSGTPVSAQSSSSSLDTPSSSNAPSQPKALRTTRPTPAFLPNFVHPGLEIASAAPGEPKRLYNNRNPTYSWPCGKSFLFRPVNSLTCLRVLRNVLRINHTFFLRTLTPLSLLF
jgi:hypothetical protein